MSFNALLSDLDRDGSTALTAQLVERVRGAIDGGALGPGERLPTTRQLAALAQVNPVTATRVYRKLAELGYVTATVGRGTFVRAVPPPRAAGGGVQWQHAVLPDRRASYPGSVMGQTMRMPADPKVVSLAAGWPAPELYPVRELARIASELFDELGGEALSYCDPEGLPELRDELARRGRAAGFATDAEEIVVTSGALQAVDLACRTIVAPGDVVVCETPTFIGVLAALQAVGARVIGVPVDEHGLDVEALERVLARHEVKLCVLQPRCQNPTGQDLSDERAARLAELARERSFFVLEDGVYATVRYDGADRPRLRRRAPEHVVYVDSLSKTVGGGLRLGWVAATGPVRDRIAALKLTSDLHTSTLVQHLGHRYLASGAHEARLAATLPVYRERRDALLESVRRRLGDEVAVPAPGGGHHLWLTFVRTLDENLLWREAIRQGVMFTPGAATSPEPPARSSLRLSFSLLGPDGLDEGVRRLAAAVRAVRRQDRAGSRVRVS